MIEVRFLCFFSPFVFYLLYSVFAPLERFCSSTAFSLFSPLACVYIPVQVVIYQVNYFGISAKYWILFENRFCAEYEGFGAE